MQGAPADMSKLPSFVLYLLINPALNPQAALIVYAMVGVFFLVVLIAGILFLTRSRKGDQASREQRSAVGSEVPGSGASTEPLEVLDPKSAVPTTHQDAQRSQRAKSPSPPMSMRARLTAAVVVCVVLVSAWAVTGYTTSNPALCKDCHWPASAHAKALKGADMHANVKCVSCHESGGTVGRYFAGVPARLIHFAASRSAVPRQGEYGRITVSACSSCHKAALKGVVINEARGIKVSHREPMAASAVCIDCHALRAGVLGVHNAGMAPCVRCHDAEHASAECTTCHDENTSLAIRARTASFADVQIPDVSCGACHNEEKECDWCHGMRLPHSTEFKMYAHARAGAVDFWYNGGKACSRCHTASRRPCQKCHGKDFGHAHGAGATTLARGHQESPAQGCSCHQEFAYTTNRDFCEDLCHSPAAIEESPR